MSGENVEQLGGASEEKGARTRQRSQIEFPYGDLDDAAEVAKKIHENAGDRCTADQLAGWTGSTTSSGAFRAKLTIARVFGVIEGERGADIRLTEIGRMIVDPAQQREGYVKAFLNVELFKRVFDDHKGHVLPPMKALERKMIDYGVPEKQADRARQVFERSAERAGFFSSGKDRLVMPALTQRGDVPPLGGGDKPGGGAGGGGGTGEGSADPIIQGLLARLPKSGAVWPDAERKLWLQLLEGSFKLIYKEKGASGGQESA